MFVQTWLAGGSHSVADVCSRWVKGSRSPSRHLSLETLRQLFRPLESSGLNACTFDAHLQRLAARVLQVWTDCWRVFSFRDESSSFCFCSTGSFPSASECWQRRSVWACGQIPAESRRIGSLTAASSSCAPAESRRTSCDVSASLKRRTGSPAGQRSGWLSLVWTPAWKQEVFIGPSCGSVTAILPPPVEPGTTNTQIGLVSAHVQELHVTPPPPAPRALAKNQKKNPGVNKWEAKGGGG